MKLTELVEEVLEKHPTMKAIDVARILAAKHPNINMDSVQTICRRVRGTITSVANSRLKHAIALCNACNGNKRLMLKYCHIAKDIKEADQR